MELPSPQASIPLNSMGCLGPERIALATDFGPGPYVGQLHLLAAAELPALPIIDLIHDLPAFRPDLAAFLLSALVKAMPSRTLYLCVVDPGVGGDRAILVLRCGENWFVGPDNGLLSFVAHHSGEDHRGLWRIDWRPRECSASFHGRDVFLPVALCLTQGRLPLPCEPLLPGDMVGSAFPSENPVVVYIDWYGNLMTGLLAAKVSCDAVLRVGGRGVFRARTFCSVARNAPFWYSNAFGLVEVAVNQGRADQWFGVSVGEPVYWDTQDSLLTTK